MRNFNFKDVYIILGIIILVFVISNCSDDEVKPKAKDPNTAQIVSIDRFSDVAATLMKRSEDPLLPSANESINFDLGDFITQGFGPDGQVVVYYNFDVQPLTPAPIYVLYKEDSDEPLEDQLNIINVIPGDVGYNDFWLVTKVTVPENYIANTLTNYNDIISAGYSKEVTSTLVNCPVVPQGSIANMRLSTESKTLDRGWYKDQIVYYFTFMEKALEANAGGLTPISPIYVTFNINPDDLNSESGPPSGIVTEPGSVQSHNVIATIPSDEDYSPLWSVYVYDNADFDAVMDLSTAQAANILGQGVMYVNCPVVYVE